MPWKTRLVGRVGEIADVEAELRRAAAGQFRCVLLLGEPGMGKTRLAAEILETHRRGMVGLSARAHPLGGTASFGLWSEALERHLRGLPGDAVSALCGGLLDDLASLLRSVAAVRGNVPLREPPRGRLLEGLAVLLANLAAQSPVLVVLDDVHLADASSWDALHYLAENLEQSPVLVILAARPGELAEEAGASRVLLDLEQQGLLTRIRLGPLEPRAVHELAEAVIGMAPSRALVEWLAERSRGNALFTLGLLQALLDERADLAAPALRSLPESLTERVRNRVGGLDETAAAVLEVLAVLGSRAELGDLIHLTGRTAEELGGALERLSRLGLVLEEERGRKLVYEIAHPLIQETIYEHTGGARRLALHRQVGRALLAMDRLGEAAPHFARSGQVGDEEAIPVLTGALRQAEEREAFREGLEVLGALVELLPPGDERWLEVADSLSLSAEWVVDHRADVSAALGVRALREIDAVLEGGAKPDRRARVKSRLTSFLSWGTGELEAAEQACAEAIALFEEAGDRRNALVASLELAYVRGIRGDLAAQEQGARAVLAAAEASGERYAAMQAVGVMGVGVFYQGRFAEAEVALQRSAEIAEADGKLYRLNWSLMSLGWMYGYQGRLAEAHRCFFEAKSVNPSWRDSNVLELEAHVNWLAGDFRAALACIADVLAWNPGGLSLRRAHGALAAGLAAVEVGQLGTAREYLDMADPAFGERDFFFARPLYRHARSLLAWREGRVTEALPVLEGATAALLDMNALAFAAVPLVDLAEMACSTDRRDVATAAATHLAELSSGLGDAPFHRALAGLGQAWAALARGRPGEAAEEAQVAVSAFSGLGYRVLEGRAYDALGRALSGLDRPAALDALRQAGALFDACHAAWRRDRSLEALRDLGARGKRAAGAVLGPASLTSREREVARLAAQRLTAREIAGILFISERTVEGHLANVYAKLGVHSKPDFARRAGELGLV